MALNSIAVPRGINLARTGSESRPLGSVRLPLLASIQGCILALLAAIGLASTTGIFGFDELVFPVSLLLTAVTAWNFYSWRLAGKGWFEPYALFLMAATLFNAGQGLLEALQLNKNGMLDGRFPPETIVSGLYLVTLALASMHFGALAALARTAERSLPASKTSVFSTKASNYERLKATRMVGWAFMVLSIVPFIVVFKDTVVTALAQGYGGLYGRSQNEMVSTPLVLLANFMIPGVLFLLAGGRGNKTSALVAAFFVGLYSVTMLALGSRGPAAMLLISFTWLYDRSIHHLPRTLMLISAIGLLSLFAFVGAIRNTPGFWQDPGQLSGQALGNVNNPLVVTISEMGGSFITVVDTIRLVPDVRPFDYGVSYAYALSTAFPNMGAGVHPAAAHGLLADWLIKTVDPSRARAGGGLGYSFIAEAFANFGWYGTMPVLACLGYLLVLLFNWGTGTVDPAKLAFIATFLASFLYFARGESAAIIRGLAWYSLIPYLAVSMLAKNRSVRRAGLRARTREGLGFNV
jgi:oligosaccharide repeat unit polymerase